MALALSNEKETKDVLYNMIVFIIGLESSNLRVILETIPDKIILRKRLEFQNVEEAHRQLEQYLWRQAKPTLVVLDDICSMESLEKLLFEGVAYETLVITRYHSTIPKTTSTQLYELPSPDDVDALLLFCLRGVG